jgi:hypothetical protein
MSASKAVIQTFESAVAFAEVQRVDDLARKPVRRYSDRSCEVMPLANHQLSTEARKGRTMKCDGSE